MARMIPSVISPEVKSNSERSIFKWFCEECRTDEWIVLHSLGISNHNSVIYGEIDFLVLAPHLGLFALEVKGGRVRRDCGIWYFTDKHGRTGKKERGPFSQARDGIFSIVKSLKKRLPDSHKYLGNVFFGFGVMFPDIYYSTVGIDEEDWQVFDCNDKKNVRDFIIRLAAGARKKWEDHYGRLDESRLPSVADVNYITSILRGDFDKAVSISAKLHYADEALIEMTKEQYRCLDQLDDNPRCLIQGSAGTGKTLLAIEETKKAVSNGEKVALFSFNSNLGDWMQFYFSNLPKNLHPAYVGTFHKFMLNIIKEKNICLANKESKDSLFQYYSEDVPVAAKKALQDKVNTFDKIIIDEAQDLIKPNYLEVMDVSLKKGLERGRWTMFGDFTMQAIYSDNMTGDELKGLLEEKSSFIRFKLTTNCRNTKPICEEIETVTGFKSTAGFWKEVEGPPVNYITYSSLEEKRQKLEKLLKSLLENHISESEITILSPNKLENSTVAMIHGFDIRNFQIPGSNKITFCTIQAYKGLENKVIILTDIDTFRYTKLMYVALSRARTGLFILESNNANKEYLKLLRRRFIHE
ncbi:MAG: NERD domain-containing protein/DEAD/DEAH box helicase [Kosmotogaceae bacterium]